MKNGKACRRFGPEWLNSPATFREMRHAGKILLIGCLTVIGCSPGRHYSPARKFPKEALVKDYTLLRKILESKHPSLYWYTSKDSMDRYFDEGLRRIEDSMTENRFTWQVLAPVISKIRCGHTSIKTSAGYAAWSTGKKFPSFPLSLKIWNDSMVVTGNANKKDSIFRRGTVITSINGRNTNAIMQEMLSYFPADGYANNINYIRISSNFPHYHRNIFGLSENYRVEYLDSAGSRREATIPVYKPGDTSVKETKQVLARKKRVRLSHKEKIKQIRTFKPDSTGHIGVMTINTFHKGHLRGFFRKSFRDMERKNINHLIIDLRSNGGGHVSASTLLTRYISKKSFRIADTAYSVSRGTAPYARHIKGGLLNDIAMYIISSKKKDGYFHIRTLERKTIHPKKNRHFEGKVYILVNGPTFSASTLFCNAVKGQPGIFLAGEETGGGWYGNNGIFIPDIKLPETKVRVRLPLFRIVQYQHVEKTGTGIIPDILIPTGYEALKKGIDRKMETVKQLIYEEINKKDQTPILN